MTDEEIIVLSLTKKHIDFLIKCVGFTRDNYRLSNEYKDIAYILQDRLKEALK